MRSADRIQSRVSAWLSASLVVALASASYGQRPAKYRGKCGDEGCHGAFAKRAVVHAPVGDGSCDICHEETDAATHTFAFTEQGAELCFQCHELFDGAVVHAPVAQGECGACHDPHGAARKGLLTADTVAALCADCHGDLQEEIADAAEVHGPVAVGDCSTCHASHAAEHAKLLVADGRALCVQCHVEMDERITDGRHVHDPAADGCLTCHVPHASSAAPMLTSSQPDLCLDCHTDVEEDAEYAAVRHSAVIQGAACGNCHDGHASEFAGILKQAPRPTCLSCHDREITTENRTIANVKARLDAHPNHHGPIRDGECAPCHKAHGGPRPAMVAAAYPARFYTPFTEEAYELCFDCHDVAAFEDEQTEDATEFRNGSTNLHYVHVNRPVKGRTCRACHDPHAASNPKYIAEQVPFGSWLVPVNFQPLPTGGTCLPGCHRRYRYDRDEPVANLPKEASAPPG